MSFLSKLVGIGLVAGAAVPVTDPTKIADPADFQDWDELGCQG